MKEYAIKMIEENDRNRTRYVHPIEYADITAMYISAFANTEGGMIIFGISDDGLNIELKEWKFDINGDEIKAYIDCSVEFQYEKFEYKGHKLAYLYIPKSNNLVTVQGTPYIFDRNMKAIKLIPKKVFLSFSASDVNIADIVQDYLTKQAKDKIKILRFDKDLKYKDDVKGFMQKVPQCDFVVSIVSDSYLKSQGCMYEVTQLMLDKNYYEKLLFIVISEEDKKYYKASRIRGVQIKADIYSSSRFNYIKYWKEKKEEIDAVAGEIADIALISKIADQSKEINTIALNIGDFIEKLYCGWGKPLKKMIATNFEEFISIILK